MQRPNLKMVPVEAPGAKPYSDENGTRRMAMLRTQLLRAAVRHVREGSVGTRNDRLREASMVTGIPVTLIEVAVR